jgi:transcriptional regulator with XRE-family HTH domain
MEFSMELTVPPAFLQRCLEAGHWNLRDLATAIGVPVRSVSRWVNGEGGVLTPGNYHALAHAMFSHDPGFAAEIATMGGTTLEALGIVQAAAPPSPTAVAVPKSGSVAPAQADAVLCAAAERLDVSPRQLRPVLAAAFARAAEMGLTTAALAQAFASEAASPPAKRRGKR